MRNHCFKIALTLVLSLMFAQGVPVQEVRAQDAGEKDVITDISPETELAIEKALEYLVKNQKPDGSWSDGNKVAYTALSLMDFMVKGDMPEQPPYGEAMSKGIEFLLRESVSGRGYMGRSMYEHGFATLALSEVWGMTSRDKQIREALKRGVDVIIRGQGSHGAWTYSPQSGAASAAGDISITVVQVVALASAKEAGIFVPDETIKKALSFVKSCQEKSSGGFGYKGPSMPGYARTAAGVTSLMLGGQRDDPAIERGLKWLRNNVDKEDHYHYGRYYGTIAMLHSGDEDYNTFYGPVHDKIMSAQDRTGAWNGQDCIMQMSILILGTPYRFIPIYQR